MITIRQEKPQDYEQVYALVQAAFATAAHRDGDEQDLVVRLRKDKAFIPSLSLVAVEGEEIAGYILFTQIELGGLPAVGLAPLAIAPAHQKKGIGTLLMQEGHRIAKDLGYQYSVVLGSAEYYPRVGYRIATTFGIKCPFKVPDENFMALPLQENVPLADATVRYAQGFFPA